MNGQHFVYFIGGPLDLTKRAFPGQEPSSFYLRFPVYPDRATYLGPEDSLAPFCFDEVTYELNRLGPWNGEPVWVGTVKR